METSERIILEDEGYSLGFKRLLNALVRQRSNRVWYTHPFAVRRDIQVAVWIFLGYISFDAALRLLIAVEANPGLWGDPLRPVYFPS